MPKCATAIPWEWPRGELTKHTPLKAYGPERQLPRTQRQLHAQGRLKALRSATKVRTSSRGTLVFTRRKEQRANPNKVCGQLAHEVVKLTRLLRQSAFSARGLTRFVHSLATGFSSGAEGISLRSGSMPACSRLGPGQATSVRSPLGLRLAEEDGR